MMITDTAYIIGAGAKKRDSPAEMEEMRKQQPLLHYNDGIGDVAFAIHSPVMFHVFPVVRREKTTGIVIITDTAYIIGARAKERDSHPKMGEWRKEQP